MQSLYTFRIYTVVKYCRDLESPCVLNWQCCVGMIGIYLEKSEALTWPLSLGRHSKVQKHFILGTFPVPLYKRLFLILWSCGQMCCWGLEAGLVCFRVSVSMVTWALCKNHHRLFPLHLVLNLILWMMNGRCCLASKFSDLMFVFPQYSYTET